jgi:hypothetical protein
MSRSNPYPAVIAFVGGTAFAVLASGGIVEERLSTGRAGVGVVVNAFIMLASILMLGAVRTRRSTSVFVLQAVGAFLGVAVVHLALRMGWLAAPVWLAERPAQVVNDIVAVAATLAVVWACAGELDVRLLVLALATLTLYKMTGRFWHLDAPPGGFAITVQNLVLAQVAATALSLPIYRHMTLDAA